MIQVFSKYDEINKAPSNENNNQLHSANNGFPGASAAIATVGLGALEHVPSVEEPKHDSGKEPNNDQIANTQSTIADEFFTPVNEVESLDSSVYLSASSNHSRAATKTNNGLESLGASQENVNGGTIIEQPKPMTRKRINSEQLASEPLSKSKRKLSPLKPSNENIMRKLKRNAEEKSEKGTPSMKEEISNDSPRRSARSRPLHGKSIIFTGLNSEPFQNIVQKMGKSNLRFVRMSVSQHCVSGGVIVDRPSESTILVTDRVRRTTKFLCAVAKGIQIISSRWLETAHETGNIYLSPEQFLLVDSQAEAEYKFNLSQALGESSE